MNRLTKQQMDIEISYMTAKKLGVLIEFEHLMLTTFMNHERCLHMALKSSLDRATRNET